MRQPLLLLLCVFLLFFCGKMVKFFPKKEAVTIAFIYPTWGDNRKFGDAAKAATKMFFEDWGEKKRTFAYEVIFEDTGGKIDRADSVAQRLVSFDRADAFVTLFSHMAEPVSVIAEREGILSLSLAFDPAIRARKYNFSVGVLPETSAQKLYDTLIGKGAKKISLVILQAAGPMTSMEAFKKVVSEEKGLEITGEHKVMLGEEDFGMLIEQVRREKPDYVIAQLQAPEIDIFMRQMKLRDVSIPVSGINVWNYITYLTHAEGMWDIDEPVDPVFLENYVDRARRDPTDLAEHAYASLQMLTHAYESLGEKDNAKVEAFLEKLKDFPTAMGVVTTDDTRMIGGEPIIKEVRKGKLIRKQEE